MLPASRFRQIPLPYRIEFTPAARAGNGGGFSMSDATHSRDQLFCAYTAAPTNNKLTKILPVLAIANVIILGICCCATDYLPMPAAEFHRLDAAIVALANDRQIDADEMWQEIYLKLRISTIAELKKAHVDDVSRMIIDEVSSR